MDLTDVSAVLTVVTLVVFVGIAVWAYSGKRKQRFDAAAQSVLEEESTPASAQRPQGRKA
jgi:cytochrome c oxidase cbb3-type subunit 4